MQQLRTHAAKSLDLSGKPCVSFGVGITHCPIPLLQHQGWWHLTCRTSNVQQWQDCFWALGFMTEALLSLMSLSVQAYSGGVKQHVWWWSLPCNYICVAASDHILFSWLPTTICACKSAASSRSEQFLWMLCWLSALTCLCPGGSWAEPGCCT